MQIQNYNGNYDENLMMPTFENTAAVIPIFNPDNELTSRISNLSEIVSCVFVINNDQVDRSFNGFKRCISIKPDLNIGLSEALNYGIKELLDLGYLWILLLDQDTIVYNNLIHEMQIVFGAIEPRDRPVLLVPNYNARNGSKKAYPINCSYQEVSTAVTSGMLIPRKIIKLVGLMKEDFFIEGIDVEYCLRMRRLGFKIIASGVPLMEHGAGECVEKLFFGRVVLLSNHTVWRNYMQLRNLTWVFLTYYSLDPKWATTAVLSIIKKIILILVYEKDKFAKIRGIANGITTGYQHFFNGQPFINQE